MSAAPFGLATLIGLVVANMIGAGVFTTSGFALADLGTPGRVMAAWLVGAVIALAGALSYGALARHMSESGGEYLFLSRALHPAAGFVAGWVSLLAGFSGAIAFAAIAFEAYVRTAATPTWLPHDAIAIGVVTLAASAHGLALRLGSIGQNLLVVLKLALILALIVTALVHSPPTRWQGLVGVPAVPFEWRAFAQSVMWISLSYSGFNAAVYIAGEARDARRNVPRALLIGTLLVSVLYLALNTIFVCAPPPAAVAGHEDVAARAAQAVGGADFALLVRVVVALALATSVSSMIMAGPRVYARMAADGVLPRIFRLHDGAPTAAIALQAVLAIAVILIAGLEELLSYLGFTLSLSASLTVASLLELRHREGAVAVPVPGYPWVPAIFVAATLGFAGLAALHEPAEPAISFAVVALGLLAWWYTRRD